MNNLSTRATTLLGSVCIALGAFAGCAAPAEAPESTETAPAKAGLTITQAIPGSELRGTYVHANGVALSFAMVTRADGRVTTQIMQGEKLISTVRLGGADHVLEIGGTNVYALGDMQDKVQILPLVQFQASDAGQALKTLSIALHDGLGDRLAEFQPMISGLSAVRMILDGMAEAPLASDGVASAKPYTEGDGCGFHGNGYAYSSQYDDYSDGTQYLSSTAPLVEFKAADECLGCCGAGCRGCSGIYTMACLEHDMCVSQYGHFRCLPGLAVAVASMGNPFLRGGDAHF